MWEMTGKQKTQYGKYRRENPEIWRRNQGTAKKREDKRDHFSL